jgi:hypothetical protein
MADAEVQVKKQMTAPAVIERTMVFMVSIEEKHVTGFGFRGQQKC